MADEPLTSGARAVVRARAMIGQPFRFQGRAQTGGRADGLDCVGLAAWAHDLGDVPSAYPRRSDRAAHWCAELDRWLCRRTGPAHAGDVLLMEAGPFQLHLGIWTGTGFVHAHARLRAVVETPGQPEWPLLGLWHNRKDDAWQP